jgi:membrane protease YdiL (CAAX protease family)
MWWKTILVPITIVIAFDLIWITFNLMLFHHPPAPASYESIPILIGFNLILAPTSEEILQCAFLSCTYVFSVSSTKIKWKIVALNIVILIIVSILFAICHATFNVVSLAQLFVLFIIYGAVYYLNDRNLLPAIVSHIAWNLLSVLPI